MRLAAAILLALALASDVQATGRFVDGSVGGPGTGTIGDPYKKIQAALNRARTAADTTYLRAGTYSVTDSTGGDSLRLYGSGSDAGGQIVLTAYPGETVTITNTTGIRRLLDANAASAGNHYTINRIAFNNANRAVDCIRLNTTHFVMDSCDVSNGRTEGVTIVGDTITVEDGTVQDFDRDDTGQFDCHCIHVDSGVSTDITAVTIQRNTIRHCSGDGVQFTVGTGVDTSAYSRGCKVLDNTFIGGNADSTLIEGAIDIKSSHDLEIARNTISGYGNKAPIVFQKGPQRGYVHDNVIHDCQAGMDMHSEDGGWILRGFRVTGNLIYNLRGLVGSTMYGFKFDGVADSKIWNNTIAWSAGNNCRGIRVEGSGVAGWGLRTSVVENNLIYGCPVASASNVTGANQGMDSTVVNYNGWFASSRTGQMIGNSLGVGLGTGNNNDQLGNGDPAFVSAGTDFHLSASAVQCIDKGTDSLVVWTFSGASPDLGYAEYVEAAPPPPPSEEVAGTSGSGTTRRYLLFDGTDTDSLEQASDWVPLLSPIGFANQVIIRLWTSRGTGGLSADSTYADSLQQFTVLLSDSACCRVTGGAGITIWSAADSMVFDPNAVAAYVDTATMLSARPNMVYRQLRAPSSGSSIYTIVSPMGQNALAGAPITHTAAVIGKAWLRVRVTPYRGMTPGTSTCSGACGNRLNGLKGLRGIAEVVYQTRGWR